ncbi:MAG: hypothetical protein AUG51_13815 [Acidobacteria bacterium 13_1_20CM_3_53_8]|nr:MAG: hypothetical protein AUG51_13815 [Acidobacteria bacterium 13_1_20CM_3_53_8]
MNRKIALGVRRAEQRWIKARASLVNLAKVKAVLLCFNRRVSARNVAEAERQLASTSLKIGVWSAMARDGRIDGALNFL